MPGLAWSPADDDRLRQLRATGATFPTIGQAIGRTEGACSGRWHRLHGPQSAPTEPAKSSIAQTACIGCGVARIGRLDKLGARCRRCENDRRERVQYACKDCGAAITYGAIRCHPCASKAARGGLAAAGRAITERFDAVDRALRRAQADACERLHKRTLAYFERRARDLGCDFAEAGALILNAPERLVA